jgi:AAA domain
MTRRMRTKRAPDILDLLDPRAQGAIELEPTGPPPRAVVQPVIEAARFAVRHFEERWVVPGLIARQEQVILTGPEGCGKTMLLRQVGVMAASGLHPFTLAGTDRLRVLDVDLENPPPKIAKSLRRLLGRAGDAYRETLWVQSRLQGLNLRSRRDQRWLEAQIAHHRPDLLIIGPLSKCYRRAEGTGRDTDEAAAETADFFDELRARYDLALLIEAHTAPGEPGDRARWRPRGSSYWLSWPADGIGMSPAEAGGMDLVHWRGARDRDTGSMWPSRLVEGGPRAWPWIVPLEALEDVAS